MSLKILPFPPARKPVVSKPRMQWKPPDGDKELAEEIRWWRWTLKYSKGTPYDRLFAHRLNECLYAQRGLFQ